MVCTITTKVEEVVSPLQSELKAILFGLQATKAMNLRKVQLESDCLLAVREILKKQDSLSEWHSILMDIIKLSLEFEQCEFNHISRRINGLAHSIARVPCELGEFKTWRNSLPPMICSQI